MSIFNLTNLKIFNSRFFEKKNDEDEIEAIKEEEEEIDLNSNLICDDINILMIIISWLKKRNEYVKGRLYDWNALGSDNNKDMNNISKKDIKKYKDDFYSILVNNYIGINDGDFITITGVTTNNEKQIILEKLSNCKEKNLKEQSDSFFFNCHFESLNKDAIIILDKYYNLTIYMDNMFLQGILRYSNSSLKFHIIRKYYPESGIEIFKSYSDCDYRLHLTRDHFTVRLCFSPVEKSIENKLERMISKITFPLDQKKLFDDIMDCLDGSVNNIALESYSFKNDDFGYSNNFSIEGGITKSVEISLFSKNGEEQTVYLDSNGKWAFESNNITIKYNEKQGIYSYEFEEVDLKKIYCLPSLKDQFEEALNTVEDANELMDYYNRKLSNKVMKK